MSDARRFVVLGAGTVGRVVVRDLIASHGGNRVLVGDYVRDRAAACASPFAMHRVRATIADAGDRARLARLLRGHHVVINCTQHERNLDVMHAALEARVHYIDLGGLFTWTRRQLALHTAFVDARLTAVLGMGCAPGITNLLVRRAVDDMRRVERIAIRVGGMDFAARPGVFGFPYSARTIVEELTLTPWIFTRGGWREVRPRTGWERVRFPRPVGPQWVLRTRHSELATLPITFARAGLVACDFKVGLDRAFVREVMRRLRAGATVEDLSTLMLPRKGLDDYEVARVVATAPRVRGVRRTLTLDCLARSHDRWGASAGDLDTAYPASIVAQMIVDGGIAACGVLPPEIAVPVRPFFEQLERRGLRVRATRSRKTASAASKPPKGTVKLRRQLAV